MLTHMCCTRLKHSAIIIGFCGIFCHLTAYIPIHYALRSICCVALIVISLGVLVRLRLPRPLVRQSLSAGLSNYVDACRAVLRRKSRKDNFEADASPVEKLLAVLDPSDFSSGTNESDAPSSPSSTTARQHFIHLPGNEDVELLRLILRTWLDERRHMAADSAAAHLEHVRVLGRVSHEMRAPLQAIIGMSQTGVPAEPVERERFAQALEFSSSQLLQLVNQILDFSRVVESSSGEHSSSRFQTVGDHSSLPQSPSSSLLGVSLKSVHLTEYIENWNGMATQIAKKEDKSLELQMASDLPATVQIDPLRVSQVLTNLVSNAVKFSPVGSVVRVSVRSAFRPARFVHEQDSLRADEQPAIVGGADRMLEFQVTDCGVGISEDDQRKLFTPFFQASSNCRKSQGTGLGLCVSRDLVAAMGGAINLRSSLGHGTTVTFTVPEAPLPQEAGVAVLPVTPLLTPVISRLQFVMNSEDGTDSRPSSPSLPRFLVVDDVLANAVIVKRLLQHQFHCVVDTALDGPTALHALRNQRYTAAFLDINMDPMDGLTVARSLRDGGFPASSVSSDAATYPRYPALIGVTGDCSAETERVALECGMSAVVTKPVCTATLAAALCQQCPEMSKWQTPRSAASASAFDTASPSCRLCPHTAAANPSTGDAQGDRNCRHNPLSQLHNTDTHTTRHSRYASRSESALSAPNLHG
eukprot:TRINITY_DN10416_c0_g1_i1.p1 TRINITY_DN10416_c0_g1~~TRINITY_DN10416_c0_g1_i1.p1  ORF type:complete len:705 (-),score=104.45 TRINITY_DN10416_c0_g1_i1:636-2726(-)